MPHSRLSSATIADRGQALYNDKIRDSLDENAHGKYLVLDVDTGAYEIDKDEIAAVMRARRKNPGAPFYILRVGYPTVYRLGRKAVARPC